MARYEYTRAVRPQHLLDELQSAGVAATTVEANAARDTCWITVPDSVAQTTVDPVVAAHDAAGWDSKDAAAVQADSDDRTQVQTYLQNIANDITNLTSDATALRDTTQTLTTTQLRAMLARADDAIVRLDRGLTVLCRRLARRGY